LVRTTSKKNRIFGKILLFAFISASYLSISPLKPSVEIEDDQFETNITVLSTPKPSGYAVKELWNESIINLVYSAAFSTDKEYMAVIEGANGGK
jgi:hypothetical protein